MKEKFDFSASSYSNFPARFIEQTFFCLHCMFGYLKTRHSCIVRTESKTEVGAKIHVCSLGTLVILYASMLCILDKTDSLDE